MSVIPSMSMLIDVESVRMHITHCIAEIGQLAILEIHDSGAYFVIKSSLINTMMNLSNHLQIDVIESMKANLSTNNTKYPVNFIEGSMDKYTSYSPTTPVALYTNQPVVMISKNVIFLHRKCNTIGRYNREASMLLMDILTFNKDHDLEKYDKQRNLLLALGNTVGELCKLFQWKEDKITMLHKLDIAWENVALEITSIFIYIAKLRRHFLPIYAIEDKQKIANSESNLPTWKGYIENSI